MRREAVGGAVAASAIAAMLLWVGPPGSDVAAHVYQRDLLAEHGFALWNNFWYAGRYSFVTYSLAYYPVALLVGIRLLAVVSVGLAAVAFAAVSDQEWGASARWPSRAFALTWAASVLSGAFPFLLGAAGALCCLRALQLRRRLWFTVLVALTLACSPLAFLLLVVVLAGLAVAQHPSRTNWLPPAVAVAVAGSAEVLLWRLFPDAGRYPFPLSGLLPACIFCATGFALTRRIQAARSLRSIFAVYLLACVSAYVIPSALGENVARLRYVAIPIALLTLALRRWRPLPLSIALVLLAASWNLTPLAFSFVRGKSDPSTHDAYWRPAIGFLHRALSSSYRVEAVDTAGHWEAMFLPAAGIPLARGWYRQDDFPQNALLYGHIGPATYLRWLHELAVRYVVLSDAPTDYSAGAEAALLRSGRSGLKPVFRSAHVLIYAVPSPVPIISGPARARVLQITPAGLRVQLQAPGAYELAVRFSHYWRAEGACVRPGAHGMTILMARRAGVIDLDLAVNAAGLVKSFLGLGSRCGSRLRS